VNDPLSPEDRALLDAGASGDLPGDGDRDRVRRKLAARLGAAAGVGTAAVATKTASAATASAGVSLGAKLVAVLAVVGAVSGGAAYVATRHAPPASNPGAPAAPPSTPVLANTANANANPSPIASAEPAPVAAPPPVATTTAPALAPAKAPAPPPHASGGIVRDVDFGAAASSATTGVDVSGAAAPTSAGGPRDALAEETRLIRSAHAFVAAGDGAHALVVLDEHARRFPAGVLTEEREAERVLALCAAGRTADAKRAGSTFLAARPRSALAPRVRGSCGGAD
jgi:hypothetical protein